MTQTDAQKKSQLAKLLATENIIVQENAVQTASFDVKSRILTLPIFKEEQKSKHVYDYLVGHEVSHALHTPNNEWADMKGRSKEFRSFVNVLEDIRIDKLIQKKYPGLKKDYQLGFKKMYKDNFFGTKGIDIQNKYCLIDKINLHFKSSKTLPITFSSKEKILVNACDQTKTFKDVLTLAEEILGYCKEELKKNPIIKKTYVPVSKPKEDIDTGEEDKNPDVKTGDVNEDVEKWLKKKEEESKEDESGSNNEDKKNTDKDKEKDKDNAQGNPTGAGGDVPITSQTNNAFDEAMHQQVDSEASKRNYVVLPKVYMKNLIVDYKTFIKDNLLNDSKEQDDRYKSGNLKSLEQTKQFIRDSNNVVNYLVKEFEMKKNARLHARSATAKTGIIDPLKLHSYKFAEDIFKKMTIIPNEKNHGMIFLLDWSGSMQKHLLPTVEQLINLVLFVRKINIPFSVYKFVNNHNNEDPQNPPFDNVEGKVMGDQSTKLVRLYTHKQTKSDFM